MRYRNTIILILLLAAFWLGQPAWSQDDKEKDSIENPVVVFVENLSRSYPENTWFRFFLGKAYAEVGDFRKAESTYKEGLKLAPGFRQGYVWLGELYFNRAEWQKARKHLISFAEKFPFSYYPHMMLGKVAALQSRFEEAEEHLQKALDLEPGNTDVLLQLGRIYALSGDSSSKALSNLRRAYDAFSEDPVLNYELGLLYFDSGEYAESSYFFKRATRLDSSNHTYQLVYGKSLYHEGKLESAYKQLRKLLKPLGDNPELHYYIGGVLLTQKKYPRAVQYFSRARRLNKNYRDVDYQIGKAQYRQGLHREAINSLLDYRVKHLLTGAGDEETLENSFQLIIEIEELLGVERLPSQKGLSDSMVAIAEQRFAIDRAEVSNEEYAVFVAATGWRVPDGGGDKAARRFAWVDSYAEGNAMLPVVYVSWRDALAYAAWAGKRLPTDQEWEAAAKGPGSREYPWGDRRPNGRQAVYASTSGPRSVTDAEPNSRGLYHIVGNAAEWCFDAIDAGAQSAPKRVYRGGHWRSGSEDVRIATRGGLPEGARNAFVGFRCAIDLTGN